MNEPRGGAESGGDERGDGRDRRGRPVDGDGRRHCAPLPKRLFARVGALRRALECADDGDAGYLSVDAFASAVATAGFGLVRSGRTRRVGRCSVSSPVPRKTRFCTRSCARRRGTEREGFGARTPPAPWHAPASRARCGRRAATRVGRGHGARLRNGGRGGARAKARCAEHARVAMGDGRRETRRGVSRARFARGMVEGHASCARLL